jgi:hypothetical protein
MLDAWIIERLERERERAKGKDSRIPLSIEPPPHHVPDEIDRRREEDERDRPKRGVVVIDFRMSSED